MNNDVDVYRIARLLIEEHGVFAEDEVKDKIKRYTISGDYNAVKTWYEIEEALNEINNVSAESE